jgi:hypothetical protein
MFYSSQIFCMTMEQMSSSFNMCYVVNIVYILSTGNGIFTSFRHQIQFFGAFMCYICKILLHPLKKR